MKTITSNFINGRITLDPDMCNGKPAIRGKRITVQTILEFLSAGETAEEILKQYPSLELEDINACLQFACKLMDHKYLLQEVA
ncbi:MAG: DUF433 domain-containing protein [Methylococcales bacterium]|nr:DUF433 domain-containing protein [Methylococcales bacterium]